MMKLIKTILVLLALYMAMECTAQVQEPAINKLDNKGRKQGFWMNKHTAGMGEAAYNEFGSYTGGRKTGVWYKLDIDGGLLAMETYRNNTLDGEVKYFESGNLTAIGHYRGLNPDRSVDTILVEHPVTGEQSLKVIPTDRGSLRHGAWRYYDAETGRLMREEDYQVDEMIYSKDFTMSRTDSMYYFQRAEKLPHNRGVKPKVPAGKKTSYLN